MAMATLRKCASAMRRAKWRVSSDDPRLMIQREPGEVGRGAYYRLYREGEIRGDWDGVTIETQKPRDGNLNRNFPAGWRPQFRQYGAGENAAVRAGSARRSRVHPGAPQHHGHAVLSHAWRLAFASFACRGRTAACRALTWRSNKRIGAMGTALTGYPVISVYEEFTSDPDQPRVGSLDAVVL